MSAREDFARIKAFEGASDPYLAAEASRALDEIDRLRDENARQRKRDGLIRDRAVENVDARHGYTMEFAPSPAQHAAEYDDEERRLSGHDA